jgi:acyl-CoA synthetase (AMP-forming)/AMP-acid ligase II
MGRAWGRAPSPPAPAVRCAGGTLNVSYNCLDRHIAAGRGDHVAIVYEGDEVGSGRKYTYSEALREVCRVANVMKEHGVRKGDTVAVYVARRGWGVGEQGVGGVGSPLHGGKYNPTGKAPSEHHPSLSGTCR